MNEGAHSYTYDAENNLVAIDGGSTATYGYSALNWRDIATANGQTVRFGFDQNGSRTAQWSSAGALTNAQFYANGKAYAYWSSMDSNIHFEHADWVGAERVHTTPNGIVEGTYANYPFGENAFGSGNDEALNHFASLDADVSQNTGLSHATFREYHASSGRWMSPDPYSGSYDAANPQSLNRYAYALNSPVAFTDPGGMNIAAEYGGPGCYVEGIPISCGSLGPSEFYQGAYSGGDASSGFITDSHGNQFYYDLKSGSTYGPNGWSNNIDFLNEILDLGESSALMSFAFDTPNKCAQTPDGTPPQYCGPLQQGLAAAKKALQTKGCSAFYGGQGAQTLDATTYRFLDMNNSTTGAATIDPTNVFVNSNGPYMNYTPTPGQVGPFGRYWTQSQFRGFILLHELGHQLSPITGFGPDAGSSLNQTQSGWVLTHCF